MRSQSRRKISFVVGIVPIIFAIYFILRVAFFFYLGNPVDGRVEKRAVDRKNGEVGFILYISYTANDGITRVVKERVSEKLYRKKGYRDRISLFYLPWSPGNYILKSDKYNPLPLLLLFISVVYFLVRWMVFTFVDGEGRTKT